MGTLMVRSKLPEVLVRRVQGSGWTYKKAVGAGPLEPSRLRCVGGDA